MLMLSVIGGILFFLLYCCLVVGKRSDRKLADYQEREEQKTSKDTAKKLGGRYMGKTGVINRDFTGEENNVYHDVIWLFKIYRAVNWRMQIKVNQVKHRIREEYGTDLDEFLDSIYQAGMDINQDLDDMKQRIEVINRSNKFLKLIDEAVELMRNFHPQGERYYWVLYYSYMSARKAENIDEILDLLEPHFPKITRIHRATYFRWREQAFQAVSSILWGYEDESRQIIEYFKNNFEVE